MRPRRLLVRPGRLGCDQHRQHHPGADRRSQADRAAGRHPALGPLLADAGFEGIDLTVRSNGYVLPENVEKDLPLAVKIAEKNGLSIPMIELAA